MKEIFLDENFDVDDVTSQITRIMDRWSIQLLDINGPNWVIYDYDMEVKYLFQFQVDFNDLEIRIKLEDLKRCIACRAFCKSASVHHIGII